MLRMRRCRCWASARPHERGARPRAHQSQKSAAFVGAGASRAVRGHSVSRCVSRCCWSGGMVHVGVLDCDVRKDFPPEVGFQYFGDCVQAWLGDPTDDWTCAGHHRHLSSAAPRTSPLFFCRCRSLSVSFFVSLCLTEPPLPARVGAEAALS